MRILVTGHDGYIGTVLMPLMAEAGHEAVGFDSYLYAGCGLGAEPPRDTPPRDVRGGTREASRRCEVRWGRIGRRDQR